MKPTSEKLRMVADHLEEQSNSDEIQYTLRKWASIIESKPPLFDQDQKVYLQRKTIQAFILGLSFGIIICLIVGAMTVFIIESSK